MTHTCYGDSGSREHTFQTEGWGTCTATTPLNHCKGAAVRPAQELSWAEAPQSPQSMTYLEKKPDYEGPKAVLVFPTVSYYSVIKTTLCNKS